MARRGNGYLDEATERLRDEQEKDRDPKTAYEDQMSENHIIIHLHLGFPIKNQVNFTNCFLGLAPI